MLNKKSGIAWLIAVVIVFTMTGIVGTVFADYAFAPQPEAEPFSTANGVAWDPQVAGMSNGSSYTAHWNGKNYVFNVGNSVFAAFSDAYNKAQLLNAAAPTVLALHGNLGDVSITGAVTLLGNYYLVDPNVRGEDETEVPARNPQRRQDMESTVRNIIVASGVTGQVTVKGLSVTGGFQDTSRGVSAVATKITLENLIIRQGTEAYSNFMINTNNPNNTNGTDSGENNHDSFTVRNCRVEAITAQRIASNHIAPVYTIDGLVTACSATPFWGFPQWRQYFKATSFTMKNSFFNEIQPGMNNNGMTYFMHMEGLNKNDAAATDSCSMLFENNVFKMTGNGVYCLGVYPRKNYTIRFLGNTMISAAGPKVPIRFLTDVNGTSFDPIGNTDLINSGNLTLEIKENRFVKFTSFSNAAYQINANTEIDISDNFFTDSDDYKTASGTAPQVGNAGTSAAVCHSYYLNWWCTKRSNPDYVRDDTTSMRYYASLGNLSTYTISSLADWRAFAALVNGGTSFAGKTVVLTYDLDLAGATIDPVGGGYATVDTNPNNANSFRGTFDGRGHEISNFKIEKGNLYGVGLFGALKDATVLNLAVSNATVTGNDKVGGLAGYADHASINNCSVDVNVVSTTGNNGVAQLASQARNGTVISNCITRGTVTITQGRACGLLAWGQSTAVTRNCVSFTQFFGPGNYYHFGQYSGSYGENDGRVVNCFSSDIHLYTYCETYAGNANDYTAAELAQRCGLAVADNTLVIRGRGRAGARAFVTNGEDQYEILGYMGDPAVPNVPGYYVVLPEDTHLNGTEQSWSGEFLLLELPLILNTNGGSIIGTVPDTFTTLQETDLPDISRVLRNGRLFAGWYANADFTGPRWDKVPAGLGEQVELFAKYVEITRSISTPEELKALALEVNGGDSKLNQGIVITADFSTAGTGFPGIANSITTPFEGVLYGNEHHIAIHCTGHALSGLVGALGPNGTVAGVNVTGTVEGYTAAGGVVAYNMGGVVCNASFNGTISVKESPITIVSQNLMVGAFSQARATALRNLVTSADPDVIGMQEASQTWISDLAANLGSTYDMVYQFRGAGDNPTGSGGLEATPVLFKKSKYNLLDSGAFWLSETPDVVSGCFNDGYGYNRVVSWVKLQNKTTKEVFCFFSTHFSLSEAARCKSVGVLKSKVAEICGPYIPFFIVGDYNMSRTSLPYTMMSEWADDLALKAPDTGYLNHVTFNGFDFNTYQTGSGSIIDFCFADQRFITSNSYEVLDSHPYQGQYPVSDHYGLRFNVELGHPVGYVVGINFGRVAGCTSNASVIGLDFAN